VTAGDVRRIALALPGVEEGPCYGTAGYRVRGKLFARMKEDGTTLVVKCGDDERDLRLQARPDAYFVTDHYRGYPTVLVRLGKVRVGELRDVLEKGWRFNAPKRLLAAHERDRG